MSQSDANEDGGPADSFNGEKSDLQNENRTQEELVSAADDSRKLFVGGLSWDTNEDHLKDYFSQWGDIDCAVVKKDRFTGQSRGFAFVVFKNISAIDEALKVSEHRLNNKKIDPKRAQANKESSKKVFVGGLDPEITEDQIRSFFNKFGKIEALDLPFDNQRGKRKAYIFVTFTTEAEAKEATQKDKLDIFGRKCDVRIAIPPNEANRQKGWNNRGRSNGHHGSDYSYNPAYHGANYEYSSDSYYYDYNSYGNDSNSSGGGAVRRSGGRSQGYHPYSYQSQ